jgi:hypothetical protein
MFLKNIKLKQMELRLPNNKMDWGKLLTYPKDNARSDKKINFSNGVMITLNMIHYAEYRRVKDLRAGYFAPLNGREMGKMFSKEGWSEIKNHLILNHIMEEDYYENGVSSFGYRLLITKQGPESILKSLIPQGSVYKNFLQYLENNKELSKKKHQKVEYLFEQFEKSKLVLDSGVYDFVKEYQIELFKQHERLNGNEDSYYGILNLVGSYLVDINKFNKGEVIPHVSKSNNRLYSIINTIKKEIRYYIRNGNNGFMEYDLSSSYNYVLATILNYDFFTSTNSTYSLYSLFKVLYSRIKNLLSINNEQFINITYMCPTYWKSMDITRYKELPFEDDIYSWVRRIIQFDNNLNRQFNTNDRVNKTSSKDWKGLPIVQFMKKRFPNVNTLISSLIYSQGIKSPLSLLLQRCEAYLVQEIAAKHIIYLHPNQLVFTIHDSLFIESVPDQNPELLVNEMKGVLHDFTGIMPGVKNKSIDPITNLKEIVNEDYLSLVANLKKSKFTFMDTEGKKAIVAAIEFIFTSSRDHKLEKRKLKTYWTNHSAPELQE